MAALVLSKVTGSTCKGDYFNNLKVLSAQQARLAMIYDATASLLSYWAIAYTIAGLGAQQVNLLMPWLSTSCHCVQRCIMQAVKGCGTCLGKCCSEHWMCQIQYFTAPLMHATHVALSPVIAVHAQAAQNCHGVSSGHDMRVPCAQASWCSAILHTSGTCSFCKLACNCIT